MTGPIGTRIKTCVVPLPSPSLHEGVLGPVEPTDHARLLAAEALRIVRIAAEKSRAAVTAIHGDQTLSEGAKHLRSNDVTFKVSPVFFAADRVEPDGYSTAGRGAATWIGTKPGSA